MFELVYFGIALAIALLVTVIFYFTDLGGDFIFDFGLGLITGITWPVSIPLIILGAVFYIII